MGHGVDDIEKLFGVATNGYKIDGQTFKDAITTDVRANLNSEIGNVTTDAAQQQRIIDAILNKTTSSLDAADTQILTDLQNHYRQPHLLGGAGNTTASDIYGSVTGNVIGGNAPFNEWGHDTSYWSDKASASELFAGYAGEVIANSSNRQSTEHFLQTATDMVTGLAEELAD